MATARSFATLALCLTSVSAAAAPAGLRPVCVGPPSSAAPGGEGVARQLFAAACVRQGVPPPDSVEVPPAPAPRAPVALRAAAALMDSLRFEDAARELETASSDAALTGGAGLSAADLVDVYLLHGMATLRREAPDRARAW